MAGCQGHAVVGAVAGVQHAAVAAAVVVMVGGQVAGQRYICLTQLFGLVGLDVAGSAPPSPGRLVGLADGLRQVRCGRRR